MGIACFWLVMSAAVLHDFRGGSAGPKPPTPTAAVRKQVLDAVFPKRLASQADCRPGATGQVAPELASMKTGAFTAPHTRQTAYLLQVGECGTFARQYLGTYRLAIFEGSRMIASSAAPGDTIAETADVYQDGMDRIFISGCGFGTGELTCTAKLLSAAGGRIQTIEDFKEVYDDPCGFNPALKVSAVEIGYVPGRDAHFTVERYEAACPAHGKAPQFKPAPQR